MKSAGDHVRFCGLNGLKKVREEFTALTGIPAAILDAEGTLMTRAGRGLPICAMPDSEKAACAGCLSRLAARTRQSSGPFVTLCRATGQALAVSPIAPAGHEMGYWIIGPVRLANDGQDGPPNASASAPVIEKERLMQLARFLHTLTEAAGHLAAAPVLEQPPALHNRKHRQQECPPAGPLGGAENRAFAMKILERALRDAEREGTVLSIAFMDINGLEQVNARCGRGVGDSLIENAVASVRAFTRASDIVRRVGGDAFIVIMSRCERAITKDRIYRAQKQLNTQIIAGCDITPSFSYGIADNSELACPSNMASYANDLIALADGRMRINKKLRVRKEFRH